MKKFFKEFRDFAVKGNMIDLAIGVMIATAFNGVTNSLVKDIFMPLFGWLMGGIDFSAFAIKLNEEVAISYGLLIQAILNFIITAFVLFLLIKFIAKLKDTAKKEEPAVEEPAKEPEISEEVKLLTEIRDLLKKE